jgi:hypothetical protein
MLKAEEQDASMRPSATAPDPYLSQEEVHAT